MSFNRLGYLFRTTTWGESHGPAIGAIVDGCPPGISLDESRIQPWLDRRRPGQSRHVSQRREADAVQILSGVYQGKTTGTPISLWIANEDPRPKDYESLDGAFRPGHADFTYQQKYGHRDPRGGGRSSARETAARVAAGAIARLVIDEVEIGARVVELGGIPAGANATPDAVPEAWARALDQARREGNSLGGVVECIATGAPAGWGAPIYAKLDAALASAMMSINAVKGVEIGAGFAAARARGSEHADQMTVHGNEPQFLTNNCGGILGGISTGAPIVVRVAFKPTPSIRTPLASINERNVNVSLTTHGRHDPCVALRAPAVVEAMMALVLADQKLRHQAQCGQR